MRVIAVGKRERGSACAYDIAKVRAFIDDNNRTAFVTSVTFLRLNGWHFVTNPADGVAVMEGLSSDPVFEDEFRPCLMTGCSSIG